MSSTEHEPAPPPESGPPGRKPEQGLAARVSHISRQPPPAPPGRGIVLALLGGAVLIAVIIQFTTSWGAGETVRRSIEEQKRKRPVAPKAPAGDPAPPAPKTASARPPAAPVGDPRKVEVEVIDGSVPMPTPLSAVAMPVPEGLSFRTRQRLLTNLSVLHKNALMAWGAVRDLGVIAEEVDAAERVAVRTFAVAQLARLVGDPRLGNPALDAALHLAGVDATGLEDLTAAARDPGLRLDATTTAALLFIDQLGTGDREAAAPNVFRVARDGNRPLHMRVLAARTLARWDALPEKRKTLAAADDTPEVLSKALAAK